MNNDKELIDLLKITLEALEKKGENRKMTKLDKILKTLTDEYTSYKTKLKEANDNGKQEQSKEYTKISGIIDGLYISMSLVNKYRRIDGEIVDVFKKEIKELKSEIANSRISQGMSGQHGG